MQMRGSTDRLLFILFVENKQKCMVIGILYYIICACLSIVHIYYIPIYRFIIVKIPTHVPLVLEGINIKKTH